ncbi:hypothetical protein HDU93_009256 [Gonapodya sp. JEL0774]|nr:hypothetical protein HDU93_009256 [Gonapodya sp. JEL0774]
MSSFPLVRVPLSGFVSSHAACRSDKLQAIHRSSKAGTPGLRRLAARAVGAASVVHPDPPPPGPPLHPRSRLAPPHLTQTQHAKEQTQAQSHSHRQIHPPVVHRPPQIPPHLSDSNVFPDLPFHLGGDPARFSFSLSRATPITQNEIDEELSIFDSVGPIGQPSWGSHPHLIRPGEITPGLTRAEYRQRREKLMSALPAGSVALIGGYGVRYQSGAGVFYQFRQNADLFYLCGVDEPDAAIVLAYTSHLFLRPRASVTHLWDGPRAGLESAPHFAVDKAHPIGSLQDFLQQLLDERAVMGAPFLLYTDLDVRLVRKGDPPASPLPAGTRPPITEGYSVTSPSAAQKMAIYSSHVRDLVLQLPVPIVPADGFRKSVTASWWGTVRAQHQNTSSSKMGLSRSSQQESSRTSPPLTPSHVAQRALRPYIHELRLFKSPAELRLIKHAGNIASSGFTAALRYLDSIQPSPSAFQHQISPTSPLTSLPTESALESIFHHYCALSGSVRPSYVPVVASGSNALTMHYVANNAVMEYGDMVLMDMGCDFGGYVTDVTRTWMVGGWGAVQQGRGVGSATGRRRLVEAVRKVQEACISKCTEKDDLSLDDLHSYSLELLQRELEPIFKRPVTRRVHDTASVSRSRKLRSGMVVTVEPGIYVPDQPDYPEDVRGVGVRVEDDVAIMPEGAAWVLSGAVGGKV